MAQLFREFNKEKIEQIKNDPYFEGLVPAVLKQAEEYMASEPQRIKFSQMHLFVTTGNREIYQKVYSDYEARMRNYFLAYIFTEDERYVEPLADIMWNICDFETWALPAHIKEDYTLERRRTFLDLASTIMGFEIAEILYFIGDKLPELVRKRAEHEVRERIIESFKSREHGWEHAEHNWAAVCVGAVFSAHAYLATKEETDAQLDRMIKTAESYLKGFEDDGCCKEGYAYWGYGFFFFCLFASMVRDYTEGRIDLFKNPKVHAIALFQQNASINGSELISFSDAGRYFRPNPWLSHFLKNEYPDMEIPSFKCHKNVTGGLRYLFWVRPEFEKCEMKLKSHIYHDNQWFIYRADGYSFACKAGSNSEPHNHNDVGSFIHSKNGKVTFTDPGTGEYTRQYFSPERYSIIACSGRGHSLPVINGEYQAANNVKSTVFIEKENEYKFSIDNGYKIDTLNSLTRHVLCLEDGVRITDSYDFSEAPKSVSERFVSLLPLEITDDGIKCGDALLVYDKDLACAELSSEQLMRQGHYEETVYIVDLKLKKHSKSFDFSVEIK